MLTSRLKILPADKAFKKIVTKDAVSGNPGSWAENYPEEYAIFRRLHPQVFGSLMDSWLRGYVGQPDRFSEPSSEARRWWKMGQKYRRSGTEDANPDLINMYKQKFEEAIDNGDKEEMKRWFREIMNNVSFTDADTESGYDVRNIEEETASNDYFRKVIVTGNNIQLVLMSLLPNEDIGMEVHEDVDQFFRIDDGDGFCEIEGEGKTPIKDGSSIVIKAGTHHNIIAGDKGLKLYTIYAPPNHPPDRVQKTKAEVVAEEKQ